MITGELKSKVDRIWDTMWSGGISNPLSVIEQLTYLLFIKRLDELHTLKERKAAHLVLDASRFADDLNQGSEGLVRIDIDGEGHHVLTRNGLGYTARPQTYAPSDDGDINCHSCAISLNQSKSEGLLRHHL